jgi:hypothetical protein
MTNLQLHTFSREWNHHFYFEGCQVSSDKVGCPIVDFIELLNCGLEQSWFKIELEQRGDGIDSHIRIFNSV